MRRGWACCVSSLMGRQHGQTAVGPRAGAGRLRLFSGDDGNRKAGPAGPTASAFGPAGPAASAFGSALTHAHPMRRGRACCVSALMGRQYGQTAAGPWGGADEETDAACPAGVPADGKGAVLRRGRTGTVARRVGKRVRPLLRWPPAHRGTATRASRAGWRLLSAAGTPGSVRAHAGAHPNTRPMAPSRGGSVCACAGARRFTTANSTRRRALSAPMQEPTRTRDRSRPHAAGSIRARAGAHPNTQPIAPSRSGLCPRPRRSPPEHATDGALTQRALSAPMQEPTRTRDRWRPRAAALPAPAQEPTRTRDRSRPHAAGSARARAGAQALQIPFLTRLPLYKRRHPAIIVVETP